MSNSSENNCFLETHFNISTGDFSGNDLNQEWYHPEDVCDRVYLHPTTAIHHHPVYGDGDFDDFNVERNSFCSTCSSTEDFTESDDEDASQKWPWISDIEDNGNLMFIQTYQHHRHQRNTNHVKKDKWVNSNCSKNQSLQGKLKNAIRKSRSFSKKDIIDRNFDNYRVHDKRHISTTQEILTITDDGVPLICKDVTIYLHGTVQANFANLESVLGIISGLDLDPIFGDFDDNILMNGHVRYDSNVIVVQGIIPNSAAAECGITIGDVILAINGLKVNFKSVNSVIEQINGSEEITLTIERQAQTFEAEKPSELCSVVTNTDISELKHFLSAQQETCCFSYLTLDSDENTEDILFWYPEHDKADLLKKSRGIFATLSDVMIELLNEQMKSSILYLAKERINVVYLKINENIVTVAAPNKRCDMMKLRTQVKEFIDFLIILNGSITRAFADENLMLTKHKVALFMDMLIQRKLNNPIGGMKQFQLSQKTQIEISNVLTDGEAADYGECVDDFFPHQRLYSTIGTCLFYKDNLVCSHLTKRNLSDVVLFLQYHWLFLLTKNEKLKKLVIWKEICLDENESRGSQACSLPFNTRCFLLIVGQNHSLFLTLLETGGAASHPDGNPGPHPYYVDTAWSILNYLNENIQYENMSKISVKEAIVPLTVHPNEAFYMKLPLHSRATQLIQRRVPVQPSHRSTSKYFLSGSFTDEIDTNITKGRSLSHNSDVCGVWPEKVSIDKDFLESEFPNIHSQDGFSNAVLSAKVTAGLLNTLHYYAMLSNINGVFIASSMLQNLERFSFEIFQHFILCCKTIHQWFLEYQDSTSALLENGVLLNFDCTKSGELKKGSGNICLWVVGRRATKRNFSEEIYVCFQDGTPQNVVEMAFKLHFGCNY